MRRRFLSDGARRHQETHTVSRPRSRSPASARQQRALLIAGVPPRADIQANICRLLFVLRRNSSSFKAQSEPQRRECAVHVLLWIFLEEDTCQIMRESVSNMQVEQLCIHKTVYASRSDLPGIKNVQLDYSSKIKHLDKHNETNRRFKFRKKKPSRILTVRAEL